MRVRNGEVIESTKRLAVDRVILSGEAEQITAQREASTRLSTYLVLSADHSSRLANAFGLAFLRRVLPQDGLRSGFVALFDVSAQIGA